MLFEYYPTCLRSCNWLLKMPRALPCACAAVGCEGMLQLALESAETQSCMAAAPNDARLAVRYPMPSPPAYIDPYFRFHLCCKVTHPHLRILQLQQHNVIAIC